MRDEVLPKNAGTAVQLDDRNVWYARRSLAKPPLYKERSSRFGNCKESSSLTETS